MNTWPVAGVQMDCELGNVAGNLAAVITRLNAAADTGAKLIVFPECVLTGYGLPTRAAAFALAQSVPGPATDTLASVCRERGVTVVVGMLERDGPALYNVCVVVGPDGYLGRYRKTHLPCVGLDRFTDPGNGPFEVFDLSGLKFGITICFDGSFPETVRMLTLAGADLVLQPTNWADKAIKNATLVARCRAFENHIYFMPVNRIGNEAGYHYIGHSSIVDYNGDPLQFADHDGEAILCADLDPTAARQKTVVHSKGEYEIDRVNWRRPDLYGPLIDPAHGKHR